MEFIIQGRPIRHKFWSKTSYVKMRDGFTYDGEGGRVDLSLSAFDYFEPYEEPKQPRKMLAFISDRGYLNYVLENSPAHGDINGSSAYTRAEGFDLIEKLGGEV